ncbi:MAG: metal ABC transporter ATP-binding protein [Brachyspira sp.]|nr:metal ABC transporter ATP-binding protein [Brachyspira sp.]
MNKVIEFDKVYFGYNSEHILKNISFFVNEGDFVSIIGSNGAGKSTILKLMIGEINQSKGNIKIYKEDIKKFNDWHYIGYLEQNAYYKILNFPATVYEVIMSNLFFDIETLKLFDMEKYSNRMISKLSGGQIQRVFLARTLVANPKILILDEPTNGVDSETIDIIYNILRDLNQNKNISIIMVTHDIERVSKISNRIFCFEEGNLMELNKEELEIELSHKHKHPHL